MSLASKGAVISLASLVAFALGVGQAMILSRALGPAGVGQLSFLRQTLLLGANLSTLGLPVAMVHAINKGGVAPQEALRIVLTAERLLVPGAIAVVLLLLRSWSGGFFPHVSQLVFVAAAVWIATVVFRATYYNLSAATLDSEAMARITVLPPALALTAYGCLWLFGEITFDRAVVIEASCLGVFSFLLAWSLGKLRGDTRPQVSSVNTVATLAYLRRYVPFGLKLVATGMLFLANGLLTLSLLRWLSGNFAQVGYYSRGLQLASVAALAVESVQRLLYASWSAMEGEERARSVENVVNVAFTYFIGVSVLVLLLAKPLVIVLFGPDFAPAVPVARIMLVGTCALLLSRLLQSLFNADGTPGLSIAVFAAGLAVNIAASLVLVPRFAAVGSALAVSMSYVTVLALALGVGRRRFGLRLSAMLLPSPSRALLAARSLAGSLRQRLAQPSS